jgi:CRISPR-associated endoribonuclease Cas6
MLRIRLQLPKSEPLQQYDHYDLIHDALINAWVAAGADNGEVIGHQAKPWTFAPLGWHRGHTGIAHGLVISTADAGLARIMSRLDPAQVVKRRWDAASINFAAASVRIEPDPILPQQSLLGCLMLSPLVLHDETHTGKGKRWHQNLSDLSANLSSIINRKLSFIAGRDVQLSVAPDTLYLRANPRHSVLVSLKTSKDGRKSFVIGMQAPLLLEGSEDDLRLAWYAGIGEKTRSGFGCLGLLEQEVGR